ncbi:MAG: hypothetical protein V2I33_23215 [Kangiellaceae bacterium]|nr:hypothetical protein [Kangiellaceae bacterium]
MIKVEIPVTHRHAFFQQLLHYRLLENEDLLALEDESFESHSSIESGNSSQNGDGFLYEEMIIDMKSGEEFERKQRKSVLCTRTDSVQSVRSNSTFQSESLIIHIDS